MAPAVIAVVPATYDATLRLTAIAIAIWCTLSSLEWLVLLPEFRPGRALGRDTALLRKGWLRRGPGAYLFSSSALLILAASRLVAGIGLAMTSAMSGATVVTGLLLAIVALSTGLLSLVTEAGDGADKIGIVACVAAMLILSGELSGDRLFGVAGIAWGSGQLTIAYFTSGAAKVVRPFWRDGTAVAAAMTSYRSGHAWSAAFVRHGGRARILAWAVMIPEIIFPVALIAPPYLCLLLLLGFAAFHFATALIMGLNTYPWGFMATYPCMLMANGMITGALGLWHGGGT